MTEAGEIEFVEKDRKKQVSGATMFGFGVAVLGFQMNWIPSLDGLGSIELGVGVLLLSLVLGSTLWFVMK